MGDRDVVEIVSVAVGMVVEMRISIFLVKEPPPVTLAINV